MRCAYGSVHYIPIQAPYSVQIDMYILLDRCRQPDSSRTENAGLGLGTGTQGNKYPDIAEGLLLRCGQGHQYVGHPGPLGRGTVGGGQGVRAKPKPQTEKALQSTVNISGSRAQLQLYYLRDLALLYPGAVRGPRPEPASQPAASSP